MNKQKMRRSVMTVLLVVMMVVSVIPITMEPSHVAAKNSHFVASNNIALSSITNVVKPTGKATILNTIANSAKKQNDVIWDKSKIKNATHYEVNWKARSSKTWASKTVGNTVRATTTKLTIKGLYEFRVRPKRIVKVGSSTITASGDWSNTVYRYFHTTERIRLASKAPGSFTISWKHNPQATGYQIMYTTNSNGAGAANNIKTVGARATSYTQKGLKKGTTYYVQIREIRKVGNTAYIGNISCPVAVKTKTASASSLVSKVSGGGRTVYWTPNGKVYHLSRSCSTLSKSRTVYSGTISESGKSRACYVCGH